MAPTAAARRHAASAAPAGAAAPPEPASPPSPTSPYAALGYLVTPGGRRAEPRTPARGTALPPPLHARPGRVCGVLAAACPVVRPALEDAEARADSSAGAYVASLLGSLAAMAAALVADSPTRALPPTPQPKGGAGAPVVGAY